MKTQFLRIIKDLFNQGAINQDEVLVLTNKLIERRIVNEKSIERFNFSLQKTK